MSNYEISRKNYKVKEKSAVEYVERSENDISDEFYNYMRLQWKKQLREVE